MSQAPIYYCNTSGTKAYKVEGSAVTKVEFTHVKLGDFHEVEGSVLYQKVSEKDLLSIRQNSFPSTEATFNNIALKVAMYNLNQLMPPGEEILTGELIIQKS